MEAHAEWLRLRTVPAEAVLARAGRPPLILRRGGRQFPPEIAPARSSDMRLTGDDAIEALRAAFNDRGGASVIRLTCSHECQQGALCATATASWRRRSS